MHNSIWDILDIKETKDKREIKIAYAKKSKNIHPEENPKGFQILYDAYKTAVMLTQEITDIEVATIVAPVGHDEYSFYATLEKQKRVYEERTKWIFDKLEYMMKSQKYEDWHDDSFWDEITSAKEFNEYKYTESFIDSFTPYIINNEKILNRYLDKIYKVYDFDKVNENTLDDLLYPLYLYLKDQLYGFINIANTCTKRLWCLTGLSTIMFLVHSNKVFVVLLCSIAFVWERLFYQVPKYKNQETFSNDIYETIRWSYMNVLLQIGIQYTFVVIRFPNLEIMSITLVILTTLGFVFSIIKKYKNPEVTEFFYQLFFLILSAWSLILGDKEQLCIIAIVSNISLFVVYTKWIIGYIRQKVIKEKIGGLCKMFPMHYIAIVAQYVLLLVGYK